MINLRIEGTEIECFDFVRDLIETGFIVKGNYSFYRNRGSTQIGRLYVQVSNLLTKPIEKDYSFK